MKLFRRHFLAGLFVLIPAGITFMVLRFIYNRVADILGPLVRLLVGGFPNWAVELISFILLLVIVYVVGLMASNLTGKRLIALGERLILKLPLVEKIYSSVKQVIDTFSTEKITAFKEVALVEFPNPDLRVIGFLTGRIESGGKAFYFVFIPTTPNPTTGFLQLVPESKIQKVPVSVEDAFKIILSGGIVLPPELMQRNLY